MSEWVGCFFSSMFSNYQGRYIRVIGKGSHPLWILDYQKYDSAEIICVFLQFFIYNNIAVLSGMITFTPSLPPLYIELISVNLSVNYYKHHSLLSPY